MLALNSTPAFAAATCVGVVAHLVLFRVGDWELAGVNVVLSFAVLDLAVTGVIVVLSGSPSIWRAIHVSSTLLSWVIFGVFYSMLVYRAFFHRLHCFPGPFAARLSSLHAVFLHAKSGHLHHEMRKLHAKYGSFVRVGPREISITDPLAVEAIHATQSQCIKGPFYTTMDPLIGMQHVFDKKEHTMRRRAWDRSFTGTALRNYEGRLDEYTNLLLGEIRRTQGTPINMSDWFDFYGFDIMGDLGFGKSFEMLSTGIKHFFLSSMHANMKLFTVFAHLPWLLPFFKKIPGLNFEYLRFQRWVIAQVKLRMKNKPEVPDVFSLILDEFEAKKMKTRQDLWNLYGDGHLVVVAGGILTCMFYHLALNPGARKKLQVEIDAHFGSSPVVDNSTLAELQYLQAVMDESMRLNPVVPGGTQRVTPPEGLCIGETFIPGDTIVQTPSFTMFRDERAFEQPDDFIPERWTTRPELVKDATGFVPFGIGRYICAGRPFALLALRQATVRIIREFDFGLAPTQDPEAFAHGLKDTFTLSTPALHMVFTPRTLSA